MPVRLELVRFLGLPTKIAPYLKIITCSLADIIAKNTLEGKLVGDDANQSAGHEYLFFDIFTGYMTLNVLISLNLT